MTDSKKPKSQADKPKKPKLVRDSFTIPKAEYEALGALKERALGMKMAVKKGEILRAGLMALMRMDDTALRTALTAVPTLKTGRPAAEESPPAVTTAAQPKAAAGQHARRATKAAQAAQAAQPSRAPAAKRVAKKQAAPKAAVQSNSGV